MSKKKVIHEMQSEEEKLTWIAVEILAGKKTLKQAADDSFRPLEEIQKAVERVKKLVESEYGE